MAVFTFSEPQAVFTHSPAKPSLLRRVFDAIVEARTRQAEREVAAHLATLDEKTRRKYDLGDAVVGKNGMYVWPF